jgi:hypothetical protein
MSLEAKYLCNCGKNYFYLNPAGCCNGAKMCPSEQNIYVIVAKISLLLHCSKKGSTTKHANLAGDLARDLARDLIAKILYYCSKIVLVGDNTRDLTKELVAK